MDMVKEQQSFKKGEICDSVSIYVRGGAGGKLRYMVTASNRSGVTLDPN